MRRLVCACPFSICLSGCFFVCHYEFNVHGFNLFTFFDAVDSENEAAAFESKVTKETIDFKEVKRVDHILQSLQRKVIMHSIATNIIPCSYIEMNKFHGTKAMDEC